ncbi:MAG: hypothetical protein HN904_16275 [Victivallales bacterium]|jgi:small ligand-binding sensory domain FIST|nr:hypothetical protein [Victivallales bacterium]MBT7164338.1 hypothetical protein [Victivallales bacterium]
MRAGIGYCGEATGAVAGRQVAQQALADGAISRPDLVLAFCAAAMDEEQFLKGIKGVVGESTPVAGGTAMGLISNHHLDYTDCAAAAAVLQWDSPSPVHLASADGLDRDGRETGRQIIRSLGGSLEEQLLFLFYDSVRVPPSPTSRWILNSSAPLLEGIEDAVACPIPAVGAGLVGDFQFTAPRMFCGDKAATQHAVAVAVPRTPGPYIKIMHGCTPLDGSYHTITKIDGACLYEIDGLPVVDAINELYGNDEWQQQRPVVSLVTIGRHFGEKYGEIREQDYINRLITGVLPDGSGIGVFEPDLVEGDEIQFMLRDTDRMVQSARENSAALMAQVVAEGHTPALGFYIDCAGRTAQESRTAVEEAAEVQAVFNQHGVPLLGIYSGVEIAPFNQRNYGLDWTGVLTILTEEEAHAAV